SLVEDAAILVRNQVVIDKEEKIIIKIFELKRLPNYSAYLYHWLKNYGFTAWTDVNALVDAQSGKAVFSERFRLLKDREVLILEPVREAESSVYEIGDGNLELMNPLHLRFETVSEVGKAGATSIFADKQKLKFPLVLRK